MGKNRDRLSIVAAILEATNTGASKTRIMFAANLSFNLLEKYLAVVLKSEFVRVEDYRYLSSEREKLALSCDQAKLLNSAGSAMNANRRLTLNS